MAEEKKLVQDPIVVKAKTDSSFKDFIEKKKEENIASASKEKPLDVQTKSDIVELSEMEVARRDAQRAIELALERKTMANANKSEFKSTGNVQVEVLKTINYSNFTHEKGARLKVNQRHADKMVEKEMVKIVGS